MAVFGALALLVGLALVVTLHAAGQRVWAVTVLAVLAVAVAIYLSPRLYAWRYVVPGALAVMIFVVAPLVYSFTISFTNYSSTNLLSFERATAVLLARVNATDVALDFKLHAAGDRYRFDFTTEDEAHFVSEPVALGPPLRIPLHAAGTDPAAAGDPLTLKDVVALQAALQQ